MHEENSKNNRIRDTTYTAGDDFDRGKARMAERNATTVRGIPLLEDASE